MSFPYVQSTHFYDTPLTLAVLVPHGDALTHYAFLSVWNWHPQKLGHYDHLLKDMPQEHNNIKGNSLLNVNQKRMNLIRLIMKEVRKMWSWLEENYPVLYWMIWAVIVAMSIASLIISIAAIIS